MDDRFQYITYRFLKSNKIYSTYFKKNIYISEWHFDRYMTISVSVFVTRAEQGICEHTAYIQILLKDE